MSLLTTEIEHIDADAVEAASKALGIEMEPTPQTIRVIQVLKQHVHVLFCMFGIVCGCCVASDHIRLLTYLRLLRSCTTIDQLSEPAHHH